MPHLQAGLFASGELLLRVPVANTATLQVDSRFSA